MLEFGIVNFWVYVLGAFAVIIAPGPNSLFVLKTAVTEGRRPALAGALAVLVGDSVLITCSFVGVAAMLAAHPDLFMWVRTAGRLYLAWLGFKILYSVYGKKKTAAGEDRETRSGLKKNPAMAVPKPGSEYSSFQKRITDSEDTPPAACPSAGA